MTNDDERGEGGKKCRKFDDVICERPLTYRESHSGSEYLNAILNNTYTQTRNRPI